MEHLNFFNKIIELLDVDMNIDEDDKAFILLSSLPESYNHIVATIFILEEVTTNLLSNETKKGQIKMSGRFGFGSYRKERRKKKVRVRRRHVTSVTRKVSERLQTSTKVVEE